VKNDVLADRELVRGAARLHDLCYILSKGKALVADDIAHTSVIGLYRGQWGKAAMVPWNSTAIAVAKLPAVKLVFVGEDGQACAYASGDLQNEVISPAPRMIRNARCVEGFVYACGMDRQVFRRAAESTWTDVSPPARKRAARGGFEAIDGYSEDELYAVGWNGEIWHFDGKRWMDRSGPTNVILSAVCCAGDGVVYAAGQQGVMVRGRDAAWEIIPWEGDVSADLWDLCWFDEKLYIATMTGLYVLKGNTVAEVKFPAKVGRPTCFSLTAADGVLWSIGRDDVIAFDGKSWQRYD
jgi:hypothetical protein